MIVCSVYSGPHDAALCILKDGKVLLNLEKERFTRIKHDGGFSIKFFEFCLECAGVAKEDIDIWVVDRQYFDYDQSELPKLLTNIEGIPIVKGSYIRKENKTLVGTVNFHQKKLPIYSVHHHLAHAAGAYYTSPFDKAAIITADSGGMGVNFSLSLGFAGKIENLSSMWGTPLGFWWSVLPKYYGATQPGTLMAIGAYGKDNKLLEQELLGQMFTQSVFPIERIFFELDQKQNYNVNRIPPENNLDPAKLGEADLALALQNITDNIFSGWFSQAMKMTKTTNVCFSGGLALNCIGNTRAALNSKVEKIHVPPNANDSGLAMGAALAVW